VSRLTRRAGAFARAGHIRNTGVVKTAAATRPPAGDAGTRAAVARLLMEQGPVTVAAVAAELDISAAAVRRHLDALITDGEARTWQAARHGPRGRGRPARQYLLTDAGRARFGHGYDELAVEALRYLVQNFGDAALRGFATSRVTELLGADADGIAAAASPDARADALARVLTARGYAARAREAGSGVQLCQHHCPVAHVASEFPQLCEAETAAFSELLGTHVQRLATIARGDAACTTHVPLDAPKVRRKSGTAGQTTTTTIPRGRQPE
jgi:predicted ArsR family transcriptional regulator